MGDGGYSKYSVGSFLSKSETYLYQRILLEDITAFIWQRKAPSRVEITTWLLTLGKLKTGEFLFNLSILSQDHALCCFCKNETESCANLFLTCKISWSIWMSILKWWGISTVMHSDPKLVVTGSRKI